MTSRPRLHRVLRCLVELSLILAVAAVVGLMIFNAFSTRTIVVD